LSTAECVNMTLTPADYNKRQKFYRASSYAEYMTER
jgi:hypothetical protein